MSSLMPAMSPASAEKTQVDAKSMILLNNSFVFCYVALLGVSLVTIIEALRTKNTHIRHMMNLESSISLVAGIVYSVFVAISSDPTTFDLQTVTRVRYMDWVVTTPLLLLVLMMFFTKAEQKQIHMGVLLMVIALDLVMLGFGYLAELGTITKTTGWIMATAAFFGMLAPIYFMYVGDHPEHLVVFGIFTTIWFLYGIAFLLDETKKNLMYNVLDVIAKGMFGFFLWLYYAKIVTV